TPNVQIEILGVGAESLLGGDLTDPENDGLDEAGAAADPSWNWVGITSSHEPDFEGAESAFNIFDNKVGGGNDKWCCDDPIPDAPVWVAVEFQNPISLTHFTVASGNDTPTRDPVDWAIQGSNDGETYTDLFHFTDTIVPWTERNQVVKFTLPPGAAPYSFIRYIAYDTPDALHQLNEIEYFGTLGELPDADKDGMPDEYETSKGFNPNDAADAALDFDKDGVSNLDEYKAGTDPIDVTKPVLQSATATGTYNTVILTFSENVEAASATTVANYAITPALTVTAASVSRNVVTLTTAAQTPGATAYTVTVNNVLDTSKNAVATDSTALFYSYLAIRSGVLKISTWTGIAGTPVQNLYDDPRYQAGTPDSVGAVFSFNSRDFHPTDALENYGAVVEGLLTPTESGNYHFFLRSDDASELYISTDNTAANLAFQAQETGCCAAFQEPDLGAEETTAVPIALVANQSYFIRAVYKEGGGGDYVQVAWRKEGDTTPAANLLPIPGRFLSATSDLPAPPDGAFLTQTPANRSRNISPGTAISLSHRDGKTELTAANVALKLNGAAVAPVVTKEGNVLSVTYTPAAILPSGSTNTVVFEYRDAGGNPATYEWSFTVLPYSGPTLDKVASYPALISGASVFTADRGGRSGQAGDYGMDLTPKGGALIVLDADWANVAAAKDEMSVSFWAQKYDLADNSVFWFHSPTAGRTFQAHLPWSDGSIYFDTAGCCVADTQRISANIDTFPGYTGDAGFWTNGWRHFVFTKKADVKEIWIDGTLFLSGSGANPLVPDIETLYIGSESATTSLFHGKLDDFAVFSSQLTQADVTALSGGTSPSGLPAARGLIAFWDFNGGAVVPDPTISISGSTITFTGTLQSSATLGGTYAPVAGATSPYTIPAETGVLFYRASQ
ncbi:MAG: discoidin domain-containing protein, partial [Verrucomicrobia bacterium]|nr:discoidin domain-containing protein [Verrucomicrobiota bacterium]